MHVLHADLWLYRCKECGLDSSGVDKTCAMSRVTEHTHGWPDDKKEDLEGCLQDAHYRVCLPCMHRTLEHMCHQMKQAGVVAGEHRVCEATARLPHT